MKQNTDQTRLKPDAAPSTRRFIRIPAELKVHFNCSANGTGIVIAGFSLPKPVQNVTDVLAAAYLPQDRAAAALDAFTEKSFVNFKDTGAATVSGHIDFSLTDRTLVPRLTFTPEDGSAALALDCEFGIAMCAGWASKDDLYAAADRFSEVAQLMWTYNPHAWN